MNHCIITFLFIFFQIITITSILPFWNLSYSSINLLENKTDDHYYEYIHIVFNQIYDDVNVSLNKIISITNGNISQSNSIIFSFKKGMSTTEYVYPKNWEDIDNLYFIDGKIFVCPKGKNYLHYYYNKQLILIKPEIFPDEDEDWELKCYYPNNNKTIFFTFLYSDKINFIYYYKIKYNINSILTVDKNDKILDFKWERISQNESRMIGLFLVGTRIYLRIIYFEIIDINTIENNKSFELDIMDTFNSKYLYAFFTNDNYSFCWMIYNNNTDLLSGNIKYSFKYENGEINIDDEISTINNISPLYFADKMQIKTLKFIRNTKYSFYELVDSQNQKLIYRGIFDISTNKVVFNTNEDIIDFRPFSPYSMLLITNKSAYEICIIKEKGKCIENCGNRKNIILNSEKGNYCSSEESCEKYILIPENICIDTCDDNFYILKDNNCSICKYFYQMKHIH